MNFKGRSLMFGIFGSIVLVSLGLVVLSGLSDFDLDDAQIEEVEFHSQGWRLSGTLILPANIPNPPIAVLVHGDGPQDRYSDSGYLPLINLMLDEGIGVYTWDKPGVGNSEGNWLLQSMQDRTIEAINAINTVKSQSNVDADKVGFIGFSQAGWVVPAAERQSDPAFSILVGPAVNWKAQGRYFSRRRLEGLGLSEREIESQLDVIERNDQQTFGNGLTSTDLPDGMHPDRFSFIVTNFKADATEAVSEMTGNLLAVWGEHDLNVDPIAEPLAFKAALSTSQAERQVLVIPEATHGLLRADLFNHQLVSEWPFWKIAAFAFLGRYSFNSQGIEVIVDWIMTNTDDVAP